MEYDLAYNRAGDLVIASVGPDWDQAAEEAGHIELLSRYIIGKQINRFVVDDVTRMWINSVVDVCLLKNIVTRKTYRCDEPDKKRVFELEVIPTHSARATLKHVEVSSESMPIRVDFHYGYDFPDRNARCSLCNSVHVAGKWIDPFNFGKSASFFVKYSICETCRNQETLHFSNGPELVATRTTEGAS